MEIFEGPSVMESVHDVRLAIKNTFISLVEHNGLGMSRSLSESALLAAQPEESLKWGLKIHRSVSESVPAPPSVVASEQALQEESHRRGLKIHRSVSESISAPPSVAASEQALPEVCAIVETGASAIAPTTSEHRTTIMLRNLPYQTSVATLERLLELHGLGGRYDILYLPMDFNRGQCLGYAFVNMTNPESALLCFKAFEGFTEWGFKCTKVCEVGWSDIQGFDANVDHYRNLPVMHDAIPVHFKPVIYRNGLPVAFPPPTQEIRRPRFHKERAKRRR